MNFRKFLCKKSMGSALITTIIAGAMIGGLGLAASKLVGSIINAASATQIATQAEQYAKAQGGLLRGTEYKNLAAVAKKNITSDGDFKYEITMGAESDYDASTKQRIMTVNVYHDTDTAPIYSLDVPRYSKEIGGAEDYIVEQWHSGSEWYRVWKSGFIEQGGKISIGEDATKIVTLKKSYNNTSYNVIASFNAWDSDNYPAMGAWVNAKNTIKIFNGNEYTNIAYWRTDGY